jgi:CRP/FNR family transcriptional regulator
MAVVPQILALLGIELKPRVSGGAAMNRDERVHLTPVRAPVASEDISAGAEVLRRAFLAVPDLSAKRGAVIIRANAADPPSLLIARGAAYQSLTLPDGRRSITDIVLPADIVGADHSVLGHSNHDIVAASHVTYRLLQAAQMRELMRDPRVAFHTLALSAEARWRANSHLSAITRLNARGRLAWMIISIFERLRRNDLISGLSFNLPLTQEQIGDYLGITVVHVSRTLQRMREERLALVDRHVVLIRDLDALRRVAAGLPPLDAAASPMSSPTTRRPIAQAI